MFPKLCNTFSRLQHISNSQFYTLGNSITYYLSKNKESIAQFPLREFAQLLNKKQTKLELKGTKRPYDLQQQHINPSNAKNNEDSYHWETHDLTSLQLTMQDEKGVFLKIIEIFYSEGANISRIQSKSEIQNKGENRGKRLIKVFIDLSGQLDDYQFAKLQQDLANIRVDLKKMNSIEVPWFPKQLLDFDSVGNKVLMHGDGIEDADHPGFHDKVYRQRRTFIAQAAQNYKLSDKQIPIIDYSQQENEVWGKCLQQLLQIYRTHACQEYNHNLQQFRKYAGLRKDKVPQLNDISEYLKQQTGWRLRPVSGLLTQREFLNGLAFKIFHSTQYIRHHSTPFYTPEPDIVHEIMGHAPMLAHQEFADFSQQIGLASLGASEGELKRLANIYWYTIEFGLCREKGSVKAYGAGILGSKEEIEYCLSDKPQHLPFDIIEIAENQNTYPIASLQPKYFIAESFTSAKEQFNEYALKMNRPFGVSYDEQTESIIVDRKIKTRLARERGPLF